MKEKTSKLGGLLVLIIILGIIFRTYNFSKGFSFAHDQDLYSWIAKDILTNHHQRLVGQLTSVDGVFIGSFYYYLMAAFYGIFQMNPLSAIIPLTMIGMFNIISVFWIFKRHFGKKTAYIGSFIYAISMGIAFFDRWSVPTQPTLTWAIWFLGTILELYKGNLKFLPIYGFLAGFTWQIHIALLPILPLPIVAYMINKNKINKLWKKENIKIVVAAILVFLITLSPFFVFEIKHNFLQIKSMAAGINHDAGGPTGMRKVYKVLEASGREFQQRILFGNEMKQVIVYWIALVIMVIWIVKSKKVTKGQILLMSTWYLLILLAQFTSKRIVSEYYFTNLIPIYLLIFSIFAADVLHGRGLILGAAALLAVNGYWLITRTDIDHSYFYRKQVVEEIKSDSEKNNYKCIAINFIADPGVGVGFRYLFWYEGIKLVKPGTPGIPVYNIPIPWQISRNEVKVHFGRFGVIEPVATKINDQNCEAKEYQLDPLLGYTE